jgi:transposase-like protein
MVPRDINGTPTLLYTHLPGPDEKLDSKPNLIFNTNEYQYEINQQNPFFYQQKKSIDQNIVLEKTKETSWIQDLFESKPQKMNLSEGESKFSFSDNVKPLELRTKNVLNETNFFQENETTAFMGSEKKNLDLIQKAYTWSSTEKVKERSVKFLRDLIQNPNFFKDRLNKDHVDFNLEIQNIQSCLEIIESWKLGELESKDLDNYCLGRLSLFQKEFGDDWIMTDDSNGMEKILEKIKSNSIPKLNLSKLLEELYENIDQYKKYLISFSGNKPDQFELFCLIQKENQNLKNEIQKLKDLVSHIMK